MNFLNDIREKYNLQETFEHEINSNKESFINKFRRITEENYYSPIFAFLDIFAAKHKKYIGTIGENVIILRQRIKPFDFVFSSYKAKIEINQDNKKVKIKTTIISPNTPFFILRILFLILVSFLGLITLIESIGTQSFSLLFIFLMLAIATIYIPHIISISKIKKTKKELIVFYDGI